jgi:hypothetical protein
MPAPDLAPLAALLRRSVRDVNDQPYLSSPHEVFMSDANDERDESDRHSGPPYELPPVRQGARFRPRPAAARSWRRVYHYRMADRTDARTPVHALWLAMREAAANGLETQTTSDADGLTLWVREAAQ